MGGGGGRSCHGPQAMEQEEQGRTHIPRGSPSEQWPPPLRPGSGALLTISPPCQHPEGIPCPVDELLAFKAPPLPYTQVLSSSIPLVQPSSHSGVGGVEGVTSMLEFDLPDPSSA